MPNKNLQLPRLFIVHLWHFQWRKFQTQWFDNIYVSISRFLNIYWVFCGKNIMIILGQNKTDIHIWIGPVNLHSAEFRFMSCQNYTDTHTKGKTLSGRTECVFWGNVKKAYCLQGINKPFNFNSVKRGLPQCIEKIRALRWNFMACIASLLVNAKWETNLSIKEND